MATAPAHETATEVTSLRELASLFLRLGATAFGGPAAHIAMMEDEVVRRRGWLTSAGFLDLVSAANLIPGPNSTELAIHIGWQRRRWAGLLVAGSAFIVPATLLTSAIGWAYVRYGRLPAVGWVLYGVKPVMVAIVVQAIWGLAPKAARTTALRVIGVAAVLLAGLGVNEIAVLLAAGAAAILTSRLGSSSEKHGVSAGLALPILPLASGATAATAAGVTAGGAVKLSAMFWVFFKTGSVLFGSGYVLLAFLRAELVERLGWLTQAQLIDAIAVGQVTPGPVFTTASFIGYVLAGPYGALAATLGIFLPAFIFVALSGPLIPRLRASPTAGAFLDGVNVGSLALMVVVTFQLAGAALVDLPTMLLGVVSAIVVLRYKLNSTWLVLGGAVAGWVLHSVTLK